MDNRKYFSIITINYNNKEGLGYTIESVINQSFQDFQYIIIDGGSTDGSVDVIRKYESYIDYWVSEPDKGIYNAMNKGIKQATGIYINFMNSGDKYHSPTVLEDIASLNPTEEIVSGGYFEPGNGIRHIEYPNGITLLTYLKDSLNHQATFFKKELFTRRLYDENYKILSDFKFNLQSLIIDNSSLSTPRIIVADYDDTGVSSNKEEVIRERKLILEELFPTRILADYKSMYTQGEVPLISLLPLLRESPKIQQLVFNFAKLLFKIKSLAK